MKTRLSLSRIRLAPRIVAVVLLTIAMTLLLDLAIGLALRSTGPTWVDEQSLVKEALALSAKVARLPPAQREAEVRKAASSRKIDFAVLNIEERSDTPPLSGLIDTMRKRLADPQDERNGAYAVSMNYLPLASGDFVRQVTVVVPKPGAERSEILSVAASHPSYGPTGIASIVAMPMGTVLATPAQRISEISSTDSHRPRVAEPADLSVDQPAGGRPVVERTYAPMPVVEGQPVARLTTGPRPTRLVESGPIESRPIESGPVESRTANVPSADDETAETRPNAHPVMDIRKLATTEYIDAVPETNTPTQSNTQSNEPWAPTANPHATAPPAVQALLGRFNSLYHGADLLDDLHPEPTTPRMSVALQLPDGQWLLASPGKPNPVWLRQLLKLASVMLLLVVVAFLSIRTARSFVQPLTELSRAAERLGREREPTPITGMTIPEYATIAQTFNEMQVRLKRFIDDRTLQLAAISHDLRTPLTRMRLMAEFVDEHPREQLLADISQMEAMIAGFLAFAGEDASLEPHQNVDVAAMLISLCDDIGDRGGDASYTGPDHAYLPCQPIAMRRALANIIDNGCRYGDRVRVSLEAIGSQSIQADAGTGSALRIVVDDDGPGIAPEHYELAFTPFQRLSSPPDRNAAGSGLGLSITRGVIRGHGGDVVLAQAASGGLRVQIDLPIPA